MPHLHLMNWNFKEELVTSARQAVSGGTDPETTYYQYDSKGKRLRKITELAAYTLSPASQKDQRVYIEGFEYYEDFVSGDITETLSLIDMGQRFVMIENSYPTSGPDVLLTRYIHPSHQGSCTLETNDTGDVITYEEYHPFGTTSYQATKSSITAAAKRYRYTGMERDDETGLSYHNARYYIPWLGRWLNVDPLASKMPAWSPYSFCFNNPILFVDPDGAYPIVTITKQRAGTTLQRVIGYTGSNKTQYTRVNLYKVTVTDTEDKNFKMSFSVTRDAFAVKQGDASNGNMTMTNVAFEPKDGNVNHYTGKPMEYPAGDGTQALKLTQYGSEVVHAEANDASVELGYRTKSDVAAGVMIHVGGVYEHADGSTSCAASEGCFGVTDGTSSATNPSNDYSNKILNSIINQSNKSTTNKGKIEVIIQKRSSSERTNTKTEKQQ